MIDGLEDARDLLSFVDASPTPYHAVSEAARRLEAAGFVELDERDAWALGAGDRRFVRKAGGTIVAFELGNEAPAAAGFVAIGAHTDSPNFRVKPSPDLAHAGCRQIGVEVYGGVLWHTWLDRDLSIAGRVSLATGETLLVDVGRPVCRMPSLAIHLNRQVNKDGLVLNPQKHLVPVVELGDEAADRGLVRLVAGVLAVAPDAVTGFDLCLYDSTPGVLGGANDELVFSARLDNLGSCHAALRALVAARAPIGATRVVALYDHEEVGSGSHAGARSRFLASVLSRVAASRGGASDAADRALARSLFVSADMAHAVHPNHADKHDKQHEPRIGRGPVIKTNASQSYATDGPAQAAFVAACREVGVVPQHFVSRNDQPCGSTIGPITAERLGMRTVDVGNPMWSMHSCRETCGARDVRSMIEVLGRIFAGVAVPPPSV